jgi:hypothetical protein
MGRGTYDLFAAIWPGQTLVSARTFASGVVVLSYQPTGASHE